MAGYLPRLVDAKLSRLLTIIGAVTITGPRACGKTSTARQQAASWADLSPGSTDHDIAQMSAAEVLHGEVPRLLDEWQTVPQLWDAVRRQVDERQQRGQFILTGSAWPDDDARRHSGAGRIADLRMRTMSLYESRESTGQVSLAGLMAGEVGRAQAEHELADVIAMIVRGGWPSNVDIGAEDALTLNRAYIDAISQREFRFVSGERRVPEQLRAFLAAYAGVVAQPASYSATNRRVSEQGRVADSQSLVTDMHKVARRLFLVEDQPAWAPTVRSRSAALATPKRHLVDPSLACVGLNVGVQRLRRDPETLGFLFESLVVRDLNCYVAANDMRGVYHYRDLKARDEIDAVVEDADGNWAGFEVKLSWNSVDEAVRNLRRVADKIVKPPVALAVIVPNGRVVRSNDGVWVIPLTVLGP